MGGPEKPFDPRATIQVDAAEFSEVPESESAGEPASLRKTPPPLPSPPPPDAGAPEAGVEPPGGARLSARQRLLVGAIVVGMLAIAAIGGWAFAYLVRGGAAAPSGVASSTASPQAMSPAPSASASGAPVPTLTLPSVEIH